MVSRTISTIDPRLKETRGTTAAAAAALSCCSSSPSSLLSLWEKDDEEKKDAEERDEEGGEVPEEDGEENGFEGVPFTTRVAAACLKPALKKGSPLWAPGRPCCLQHH